MVWLQAEWKKEPQAVRLGENSGELLFVASLSQGYEEHPQY